METVWIRETLVLDDRLPGKKKKKVFKQLTQFLTLDSEKRSAMERRLQRQKKKKKEQVYFSCDSITTECYLCLNVIAFLIIIILFCFIFK